MRAFSISYPLPCTVQLKRETPALVVGTDETTLWCKTVAREVSEEPCGSCDDDIQPS